MIHQCLVITIGLLLGLTTTTEAFLAVPRRAAITTMTNTRLFGSIKGKRGQLGKTVGGTPSKVRKVVRSKQSAVDTEAVISPALSEWMAKQDQEKSSTTTSEFAVVFDDEEEIIDNGTATTFQQFEPEETKNPSRRVKQGVRNEQEEKRLAAMNKAVKALEDSLEKKGNLDGILASIRQLIQVTSGDLRQIVAGAKKQNYRLAWVGGDEAICHIGTGLHKVPLARLQEVFLSCLGRNRIEVQEIISILGPFPNVKNILQGTSKIGRGDDVSDWQITLDSMVDGTGKEILAGTDDNIRRVGLQVYFADEKAIVAVVPPKEGFRADPLENNGANVLVFVREDQLDDKLDALRVS